MPIVSALNVYPVKSCRGIALESARLTPTGFEYDREWMLVTDAGEFITQRQVPRLALVETRLTPQSLQLLAPGMPTYDVALDAGVMRAARPVKVWRDTVPATDEGDEAARWFSEFTGSGLRLLRFAPGFRRVSNPEFTREYEGLSKFADGYAILIIGTPSLSDLNRRLQRNGADMLPMNRFRPNLVMSGGHLGPYDEDRMIWVRCGDIALKPVKACVRCQITTTDQATAVVDAAAEPLLTLATYRVDEALGGPTFGQNAIVVEGAGETLRVGDHLDVEWNF